jgi:anti-sigma regulatory factor (Ser/Thr protein kinase)
LEMPPVPPLGVLDDLEPHATRWSLVEESVLVLYTDGLIERRGESLDEGLERLRKAVRSWDPEPLCGRLMDDLVGSHVPTDDIALLVLRVHPTSRGNGRGPGSSGSTEVSTSPAVVRSELFARDPSSVGAARHFISECVAQLGLRSLPDVQLMVSELATNAVVHAQSSFDVTLERLPGDVVRVEVRDFGGGMPRVLDCDPSAVQGRGLQIVSLLAESWGVQERPGSAGKSTWFTLAA